MATIASLAGVVAAVCIASTVVAHPGEHHDHAEIKRQVKARDQMASAAKRSLDTCSSSLKHRELNARSLARRAEVVRDIRQKRSITTKSKKFRRDLATLEAFEAVEHNMTGVYDYTSATPESTVFAANTSCILSPENTDGPYYVTGEFIRKNVTEGEPGIPLYLEVQYIDITTCEPVPEVYVDIWNCNSTGYYSGVVATGNEVGWDTTFLRGIQATDDDGVASFETIFPGHYDGRAIHTHLLSHNNVTVMANGTIQGGSVSHIGQLFYQEELRSAVEATYPYNTNTQAITSNADDMWSIVQAENDYDPFPEYLYLGDSIEDGLFAWIQIGINVTADQSSSSYYAVAATLQADGGHQNTDSTFVGGGSGGGGDFNGTAPANGTAPPS
ncbi:Intradiol ring-cleavage dioxygenase [Leptodontidium sp. MPI-SDFR-AT-0119]|nr:Intradiol ring-cleavage dioxygenase [Leptodontidium sp. MPI-SDFR-AT-0119]